MAEISLGSLDLSGDRRDAWSGAETPSPGDDSGGRPVGRISMKKLVGVIVCLVPLTAYAQQTYTNEDLRKFSVPGAYTNQDLKKMRPVPVVGKAGASAPVTIEVVDPRPYQMRLDLLREQRLIVQAQLDWTNQEIEKAYSFYDKGPDGYPWPGYLSKTRGFVQYLEMQIAVVDARIANVEEEAFRAGATLENP
jgi:hypothetical protein